MANINTNISKKSSYDDFSSPNLFPDNSKVCSSRYENGEYIFRYGDKGSCYTWILDDYSDFHVTVKARKTSGKDLQGYGVVFRLDENAGSYYDFIVSGNGDYSIGKFINSEFTELYMTEIQVEERDFSTGFLAYSTVRIAEEERPQEILLGDLPGGSKELPCDARELGGGAPHLR